MAKGKKKPLLRKKAKGGHRALNSRARALGVSFRGRVLKGGALRIANPAGHKPRYFADLVKELQKQHADAIAAERFNARYRALLDHHDELVSTSTVREIVFGILEGHKKAALSVNEVAEIDRVLDNISRIRLPTEFVGYATATERMQHPTNAASAYFADPATTASSHSQHDLARKAQFLDAVDEEIKTNRHWTLESAINAGARAVIAYTLNEMAAPITASDVRPHALKGGATDALLRPSVLARETMKSHLVALGGVQEPNAAGETSAMSRSRSWTQRRGAGLRSASPSRF